MPTEYPSTRLSAIISAYVLMNESIYILCDSLLNQNATHMDCFRIITALRATGVNFDIRNSFHSYRWHAGVTFFTIGISVIQNAHNYEARSLESELDFNYVRLIF
jgi:hypothetical protein